MSNIIGIDQLVSKSLEAMDGRGLSIPKAKAKEFAKSLLQAIADEADAGNSVRLAKFGTFKQREVKAAVRNNPNTGEKFESPGHTKLVFKATKTVQKSTASGGMV